MARSIHTQINTRICRLAVLVATACGGFSASALAADGQKEETITVSAAAAQESAWGPAPTIAAKRSATATKTDTPIEKTPQSVSVVTREEMDMHQSQSVKEALGYTPGVVVSNRGASTTYDFVSIRGFTSVGLSQNNYLDGLKLQGNFYNDAVIDPYMLERVELMRGPTSVLYGKSNPGGIISMVSKRPTTEPLHEVQFKMGTDNLYQTGFDFSDALDDNGEFSYRLTGVARSNDQQQVNAKQKRYAIAPSFTWRPDENTNFTFLSYFQNEPQTGYYGWLPKEGTVQPLPNGKRIGSDFNEGASNNSYSRNQKMVGYSFEHAFDDTFTVRQNLRFAEMKTAQQSVYGTGVQADGHTLNRGTVVDNERLQNFSVDTQLQSKFATGDLDHTLLTGVDFMRMRNDINAKFGTAPAIDLYGSYTPEDFEDAEPYQLNETKQTGIYVQDQAEWDKWVFTLGGRYDWSQQATTVRANSTTPVAGSIERNDHQFTWRGGVNYLFDNGISPYVSYSQSFEPNAFDLYSTPRMAFAPSKGEQYEAGVKYVPKDMPIVITGAVYQLTKTNTLTTDPNDATKQVPSGEVRSRGVELEAKAALNANINVTASYTYIDAEYTKDTKLKGNHVEQVPRNMGSLWGDYTFNNGPLSGLTIGTGGRFIGSSYGDPANTFKVGSAAVMDAVVKYDLARVGLPGSSVAVNVNNLLDREYVSSCFQTYGCFWGAERQVTATATFRF
ncbi:ferrichrome porin FhuA [Cronobacter sakazakii]|uniref:ferrichrome porin FhuA n=1 Tax=Cronobacter sakazakii TaxID=28141 RepID=UPI00029C4AD4|nr:ferrichrome porin FhuA [Cronobacter sakazakii]CCK05464.1 Ferric hydroxamate outer membrane receptor FhuA [Cronobacter sakazakii 696]EKK3984044.1 ferrichrome porin FhuA [Cronobacter sakazakii]ELY2551483.1 ferrichrome porin FhuA [Cronobacter sakazakii]ELY6003612.1 ferrichrome porin FhuA [Cronobacter sakazakii]ELY6403878.1 ferrichrome porin FhuA [Cronobacter sakazakii]